MCDIITHSKTELSMIQQFSSQVSAHEDKMKKVLESLEDEVTSQTEEQNDIINQVI